MIQFIQRTQWWNVGEHVSLDVHTEAAYVKKGDAEYTDTPPPHRRLIVKPQPVKPPAKPVRIADGPPRDKMMRPAKVVRK